MPAKKTKKKSKPKQKPEEKIIDAEVVEKKLIKLEEKPVGTKIVKAIPDTDKLMNLSKILSNSGMFPSIHNEYEAAAVIEYGRALGINHIIALQTIVPIKGKLSIESKVLYALALDKGIKVKIVEKDSKGCTLEFSDKGRDPHKTSFTEEDAKRAGLHTKDSFMKYPEEMYFNRCLSKGLLL
ncbi:unnamed protein product [marine sediment metagenome]|uniref:Uncharacterized protein n=1 Tax=marine sediment metagenome TaxID=412755 RepID=X1EFY0_9ZZZZ